MPEKPHCEIDVEVAAALTELLYRAAGNHKNPGFRCPLCKQLVSPHHTEGHGKYRVGGYFTHRIDKDAQGLNPGEDSQKPSYVSSLASLPAAANPALLPL
jgi:hypothetical protein